jgi:hypothetical protein
MFFNALPKTSQAINHIPALPSGGPIKKCNELTLS